MGEVNDLMEKAGLFGLGVIAVTEEKLNKAAEQFVKKGKMKKPEAKKFVRKVLENSKRQQKELSKRIEKETKKAMTHLGVPSQADIKRLEKRIRALEKRVK